MERTSISTSGVDELTKIARPDTAIQSFLEQNPQIYEVYKQAAEEALWERDEQDELDTPEKITKRTHNTTIRKLFGPRFENAGFDNYQIYAGDPQQRALNICRAYAENISSIKKHPRNNLIMAGKSGTGKNHLAYAIGKAAVEAGLSIEAKPFLHIMQEIKQTWAFKNMTERQLIDYYVDVDLLILEEIGVSFNSDTERIYLFDLLDNRYKLQQPTIIITNFSDDEFFNFVDFDGKERLKSRFQQTAVVIPFDWDDYRAKG